jgi:Group II intron, maturase-specific domain
MMSTVDIVRPSLNSILGGWRNYFYTGEAANKVTQVDGCVVWRLRRLMIKKHGRNLRAGQAGSGRKTGSIGAWSRTAWSERSFWLVRDCAPGRIRTCAPASGGRCSIP